MTGRRGSREGGPKERLGSEDFSLPLLHNQPSRSISVGLATTLGASFFCVERAACATRATQQPLAIRVHINT